VLDPGLGFAKQAAHSYRLLAGLQELAALDRPLLVGASRKSFLARAAGDRAPAERDWATAGAVAASVMLGAHIVRVHNVAAARDVVAVVDRVMGSSVE
jgi:dihydropteroate synthase